MMENVNILFELTSLRHHHFLRVIAVKLLFSKPPECFKLYDMLSKYAAVHISKEDIGKEHHL